MPFLDDQLPKALLDAVYAAVDDGSGGNATSSEGKGSEVWKSVASQYPLTGLWPLALLLAFSALAILAILLKLAWSLARAKLVFFRKYKIHYSAPSNLTSPLGYGLDDAVHSSDRKTRTLILPAEGSVLVCTLTSCVAGVTRALGIESYGRLAWMGELNAVARAVEFSSIWLAILFLLVGSVCYIPLFTSRTSPARYTDLSEHTAPTLSKILARPFLHPLLANSFLFIVPVVVCFLPNLVTLVKTYDSIQAFQEALTGTHKAHGGLEDGIRGLSTHNGTLLTNESAKGTITDSIFNLRNAWQLEGMVRGVSIAALLFLILYIEVQAQRRITLAAGYLEEVEEATLQESNRKRALGVLEEKESSVFRLMVEDDSQDTFTRPPPTCITRSPSFLSASSRSRHTPSLYSEGPRRPQSSLSRSCVDRNFRPSSRASSYRSSSASLAKEPAVLYVPELPDFDIQMPSPSLLRDELAASTRGEAASPYSPALALFEQRLDRSVAPSGRQPSSRLSVSSRTPSLHRVSSMASDASTLQCSAAGHRQQRRHFSTGTIKPSEHKITVEDDYFGDGKLPYDDGYEGHLEDLEFGPAIAHMLLPYDGVEDGAEGGDSRDTQKQPPSLSHPTSQRPRPSPALSFAPSSFSQSSTEKAGSRRPQSRASSYSYRSHRSSSSSFSYASSRTAASWRSKLFKTEVYQGPNAIHLIALKKGRAIDAALLATLVLFQGLLELMTAVVADEVLNSKVLHASISFVSMLLKVLPILGGVILASIRSSSPAYGWQSRHVMVASIEEDGAFNDAGSAHTASMHSEKRSL